MTLSAPRLRERLKKIRMVLSDMDGVLTSGIIYHFVDTAGELVEFKGMHAQDSIALVWLREAGYVTGVISGRVSKGTHARLQMLRVSHIYQHRLDKEVVLNEILERENLSAEQTAYLGDDLPDIPVMRRVSLAIAPANARPEVKKAAHWVARAAGGAGAFREFAEELLKAGGHWEKILNDPAAASHAATRKGAQLTAGRRPG